MSNYTNDLVGTVKNGIGCGACGPAVTGKSSCSSYGSEWTPNGAGACSSCKFDCLGSLCTTGAYLQCKKTQYTGNLDQCCLNQQPTGFPTSTCDPSLSPTDTRCNNTLTNYCKSGSLIFTDNLCKAWSVQNSSLSNTYKQNYCQPSLISTDQNCRNWINSSNTQGTIDNLMSSYCKTNPTDNLCSCINSEIPCPNKFDGNCVQNAGYETTSMIIEPCPNVMNCTQFIGLSPSAQAVAVNVDQSCSSSGAAPTINNQTSSNNLFTNLWNVHKNIIIIILLLIFVIVIAVIINSFVE